MTLQSSENSSKKNCAKNLLWTDKENLLAKTIEKYSREKDLIYIAFSGGVDSSYLLLKTASIAGINKVVAVTVKSPTSSNQEIEKCVEFTQDAGIDQIILDAPEFDNPFYRENNPLRCYHCKRSRYQAILHLSNSNENSIIFDGSQADDDPDDRPGSAAIKELGIATPLADSGVTKQDIRNELRKLGFDSLSEKQAEPCLSTRIPFGRPIVESELRMVQAGEKFLKDEGIQIVRLRHHGDLARIVTDDNGQQLIVRNNVLKRNIYNYLKTLGFTIITIDLEEYGQGA